MVMITITIIFLLALAVFIAIVSLIQWSYSKSGAQSFIKSKRAQKYEDVNDNSISSPKKGMTTNSFLENTLNKSTEFN